MQNRLPRWVKRLLVWTAGVVIVIPVLCAISLFYRESAPDEYWELFTDLDFWLFLGVIWILGLTRVWMPVPESKPDPMLTPDGDRYRSGPRLK